MNKPPYLSVIIPSYRESDRIGRTLLENDRYLRSKDYDYEMIVITDGSPDNTAEVVRNYALDIPNLRIIENKENHGKGYVVRQGLLEAKGELRLFMDADGSTSITHLDSFLPEVAKGYDVIIGSRDLEESYIQVHQAKHKEIMGDMGNWLIRIVLGLWDYADTQCGFKILTARAAEAIASRMVVDRFGFDFELMILAKKMDFKIRQLPVRWMNEAGSSVKLTGPNGYTQVIIDLFKVKGRLITGFYKLNASGEKALSEN